MIAQLKELIDGTGALSKDKRAELRGVISTKPGLNRYLRVTPGGLVERAVEGDWHGRSDRLQVPIAPDGFVIHLTDGIDGEDAQANEQTGADYA